MSPAGLSESLPGALGGPVVGRFAPSPTGPLHAGSLRTAVTAWLFARAAGGRFLLRVEDLDPDRSRAQWESRQLTQLRELGLDWDGPVLRQSERLGHYAEALGRLRAAGRIYPCFCTRAEIRAAASAPHGELPEGAYPGTCRQLSAEQRAERIAAGERHSLRFDGQGERIGFSDLLAGPQAFIVDDFILVRSDGVFAYQLAVVVDDHLQGVTQVVRGADLLDSTSRQLALMRALGLPEPVHAHVGLVMGPDGRRLAKRHGADAGAPSIAWLAASLGLDGAASMAELLGRFDPAHVPGRPVAL